MDNFLNEHFMLTGSTAQALYHTYAKHQPIIDYHCHLDPADIAEDRRFPNLTQVWLTGDHYKWRVMRAAGVEETFITGEGDDYEKFCCFADAVSKAVGNPVYHWAHLELKRYFGCDLPLNKANAAEIWDHCNERLTYKGLSARALIRRSNVRLLVTTDDPAQDLSAHEYIRNDPGFEPQVLPSFRPDRVLCAEQPGFADYIAVLGAIAGITIRNLSDLYTALDARMEAFADMGCRIADHGMRYVPFCPVDEADAERIFQTALAGRAISDLEADAYKTHLQLFLGRQYNARKWAMQIHYGILHNVNTRQFSLLGPNTGFDCVNDQSSTHNLIGFLNELEKTGELPKAILYSLNPNDNAALDIIANSFQSGPDLCKIQHGCAWWHNDTKEGIEAHLVSQASRGLLGGFIGMLTDSRSFLSYTRHEYFRRILCNLLGTWVDAGLCPADMDWLGAMVQDIAFQNANAYFGFNIPED